MRHQRQTYLITSEAMTTSAVAELSTAGIFCPMALLDLSRDKKHNIGPSTHIRG